MISVEEYLMGRDRDFPLDMQQAKNMADLLARVNFLIATLKIETTVSSGYRPSSINKSIGGAKMSTHTVCAGVDLHDHDGSIAKKILTNLNVLEFVGLCLENPQYTISKSGSKWIHLDSRKRKNIVFNP